ncbi:MAG: hypothetical protein HQM04_06610 [Magnetococcales bacterium]|nr:hypothetical protein [Magnetococcales bacterium]MBF0114698.1 hypothetical protein [Magnetococcales bacterium]
MTDNQEPTQTGPGWPPERIDFYERFVDFVCTDDDLSAEEALDDGRLCFGGCANYDPDKQCAFAVPV